MELIKGKIPSAQKIVIYGPEGIGKSTLASKFPEPVFIDTEGSTKHLDITRMQPPTSWAMLMEEARYVRDTPGLCRTLVIDTADWAEQLCIADICARRQTQGIEDFGYGKGYVYLAEQFGGLLNLLSEVVERGVHVVLTAHAQMRKFEQPDEMGAYDRWELKLSKKVAPLVKEWADMVLFANYKTFVVNVDGQGAAKGKNKAQGGERVLYTSHHPCWDAKNRYGLPPELKMDYEAFAHCLTDTPARAARAPWDEQEPETKREISHPAPEQQAPQKRQAAPEEKTQETAGIPKKLLDLMNSVTPPVLPEELQQVVYERGHYPADTPIKNYDPAFVDGVLIGAWPQVLYFVEEMRKNIPF